MKQSSQSSSQVTTNSAYCYRFTIGDTDFYYHWECLEALFKININKLSQKTQVQDKKLYKECLISDAPEPMNCSAQHCWRSLREHGIYNADGSYYDA